MSLDYLDEHVASRISDDIRNFVDECVFGDQEYLFIDKSDKKRHIGHCSKCGSEYAVYDKLPHNHYMPCPECGHMVQIKSLNYSIQCCKNEAVFYYFEKSKSDPTVVVCRGIHVVREYQENYKKPKTDYSMMAAYIFEGTKSKMYKNSWNSGMVKTSSIYDFNQGWMANVMCHCSFDSIGEAVKDTPYQYMPYEEFAGHYSMVKLFEMYRKYPWIEQLCKVGFKSIIEAKLRGHSLQGCLNYKGKNIFRILKLSRKDLKDIRKSKIAVFPEFLRLYQLQINDKTKLNVEEISEISANYSDHSLWRLPKIMKYNVTLKKAMDYVRKQRDLNQSNFHSEQSVLTAWADYINDCTKLGWDLRDKSVLFPKDIYKAHQNTIKHVKIEENKGLNVLIEKRLPSLQKYCFEFGDLLIRPAKDSKELIEEGAELHHCVGGYGEKYAKGHTNILLVRKAAEPAKPYYTIELSKNEEIIQVRGDRNCSPTPEVKEYLKIYASTVLKNKTQISA